MNKKLIEDIQQSDLMIDFTTKSSEALKNYIENDTDEELYKLVESIIQKLSSGFKVIFQYELDRIVEEIKFELNEIKQIQKSINERKNKQQIDDKLDQIEQNDIKFHIENIKSELDDLWIYLLQEQEDEEYNDEVVVEFYKDEYDSDYDDDGPYCYACQESPCMCSDPERTSTVW